MLLKETLSNKKTRRKNGYLCYFAARVLSGNLSEVLPRSVD